MKRLLAVAALVLASSAAEAQYVIEYGGKEKGWLASNPDNVCAVVRTSSASSLLLVMASVFLSKVFNFVYLPLAAFAASR